MVLEPDFFKQKRLKTLILNDFKVFLLSFDFRFFLKKEDFLKKRCTNT